SADGSRRMMRAARVSSTRSNSSSWTPVACFEKTLKLTPLANSVAPSGELLLFWRPSITLSQQLPSSGRDAVVLESELLLKRLQGRRRSERLHADDAAGTSNVAFPSERRRLLHRNARSHRRRQHAVAVLRRLAIEDLPGHHRHHARADTSGAQLLVGLHRKGQ